MTSRLSTRSQTHFNHEGLQSVQKTMCNSMKLCLSFMHFCRKKNKSGANESTKTLGNNGIHRRVQMSKTKSKDCWGKCSVDWKNKIKTLEAAPCPVSWSVKRPKHFEHDSNNPTWRLRWDEAALLGTWTTWHQQTRLQTKSTLRSPSNYKI